MTYFYKSFRRYSHFSEESVTTTFDGSNELMFDQGIQVRVKVQRVADLVRDMYFTFTLPDIYSKWFDTQAVPTPDRQSQLNFAWVPYVGCALIQNVALIIGGTKVQEFDGAYILAKAIADYDTDRFAKWKYLVGETNELTNPAIGQWGGGSQTVGYPTVYPDVTTTTQVNRPSIFGRDIHVPLPFFCNESTYQALPLIGLQYHEVEIQIQLRPVTSLYTFLDNNGYRVAYGYQQLASQAQLDKNLPAYGAGPCEEGEIRNFLTDFGTTPPALNNLFINPRLQTTYVYLTEDERQTFASTPLSYMIYQVTRYDFAPIVSREYLELKTHNPINRILTISRRTDYNFRNAWTNWTNWWNYPTPPHIPTPALPPWANYFYATGLLVPQGQEGIIRALRILGDGNQLQEEKPGNWFESVVPYRYTSGSGAPGLYDYAFGLSSPNIQPNGSINSSRIRLFQLDVDVYPLPVNTNYAYELIVYVENINWFQISSGMGGVKYAL